jgi:transposase
MQRQRYRCKACGRTFYEPLPEMHPDHLMTRRLVTYIEQQTMPRTFVELADEIGVNEKTIRLVFKSYVQRLEQETTFWTPAGLGIDEVYLLNQPALHLEQCRTAYDCRSAQEPHQGNRYEPSPPVSQPGTN